MPIIANYSSRVAIPRNREDLQVHALVPGHRKMKMVTEKQPSISYGQVGHPPTWVAEDS